MEVKIKQPNYKQINEDAHRIDCTISEADFNTSHPNRYRLDYTFGDIHRYLINIRRLTNYEFKH